MDQACHILWLLCQAQTISNGAGEMRTALWCVSADMSWLDWLNMDPKVKCGMVQIGSHSHAKRNDVQYWAAHMCVQLAGGASKAQR